MARVDAGDGGFVVELEQFQGPLDLLLHLIREQDIDIFDIPIAEITAQFLRAIEGVEALGLDRAGEFLELAATLIRIKVQLLLPRRVDEETGEWEDPRAELVRRLLEYEHFREAARRLAEAEAERARHFGRGFVQARPPKPVAAPLELSWDDLWAAIQRLAERTRKPAEHRVTRPVVSIQEKMALILEKLMELAQVEFFQLVRPFGDRVHAVVTLLAGLELTRQRYVLLRQREPFAPLWLYRRTQGERGGTRALEAPPAALAGGHAAPNGKAVNETGADR
ncbi:MAG TPA: segregation/condensation protein A [Longimicrobiales bacterium]